MFGYGGPKPGSAQGAVGAMAQRIRCTGASDPLVTTVESPVLYTVETYKNGITHSNAVNPQNFTIVTAGYYLVAVVNNFEFEGVTAEPGGYLTRFEVDGALVNVATYNDAIKIEGDGGIYTQSLADVLFLDVGEVFTVSVVCTFAEAETAVDVSSSVLAMHRLS